MPGKFNTIIKKKPKRSTFDLSHDVKLSLDMGNIVPTCLQECVPGDKFNISTHNMIRFAPLISPVMHHITVKQEFFFVPNRILWNGWETFITGSKNGKQLDDTQIPAFPRFSFGSGSYDNSKLLSGSLWDYLGLPANDSFDTERVADGIQLSALPFAAYQRIYDEYYRDENLVDSVYDLSTDWEDYNMLPSTVITYPTAVSMGLFDLKKRAWRHDYFTSALPFAQKGAAVEIPLDTSGLSVSGSLGYDYSKPPTKWQKDSGQGLDVADGIIGATPGTVSQVNDSNDELHVDNSANLTPDNLTIQSSGGSISNINDLRTAIKLQEWLETNARGGTRYTESIYAHFGVRSSDKRLQRPEFIGSSRDNVMVGEVLQTSSPQSQTDTPQGNLSGMATSSGSSRNFSYRCEEHGYIIGLMTVIPDTSYYQGIPKHFLKTGDRLQYYFPEFANLGEQEIKNAEIYAASADPEGTFGYIPRYSEYRFQPSRVCGDFRNTLKYWHMSRDFSSEPALNAEFITSDPTKRIFAVQDLPDDGDDNTGSVRDFHSLYAHVFHNIKASRLMPKYGTPMI